MEIYPLTLQGLESLIEAIKNCARSRRKYGIEDLRYGIAGFSERHQEEDIRPEFKKPIEDRIRKSNVVDFNFLKVFEKKLNSITGMYIKWLGINPSKLSRDYAISAPSYKERIANQANSYIIDLQKRIEDIKRELGKDRAKRIGRYMDDKIHCISLPESFNEKTEEIKKDSDVIVAIKDALEKTVENYVNTSKALLTNEWTRIQGVLDSISKYLKKQIENPSGTAKDLTDLLFQETIEHLTREEIKDYLERNLKDLILKNGLLKQKGSKYVENKEAIEAILNSSLSYPDFLNMVKGKKYVFGIKPQKEEIATVNPRKIRQECLNDYLNYCEGKVDLDNPKEIKKLEFAKGVLNNDLSLVAEDYLKYLYNETKEKLKGRVGKKGEGLTLGDLVKNKEIKELLESAALEELKALLQFKGVKDEKRDSLELVLEKYKPEVYAKEIFGEDYKEPAETQGAKKEKGFLKQFSRSLFKPLKRSARNVADGWGDDDVNFLSYFFGDLGGTLFHSLTLPARLPYAVYKGIRDKNNHTVKNVYELEVSRDPKKIKKAAKATGSSCIRERNLWNFRRWASDPGTIFLIAKQNGKVKGYVRNFLEKDHEGNLVLAIDTMEPPGKSFDKYGGLINAMGLAAVQLGLDIGAKYVISNDSRIKYGPRQAFSNKEKRMKLEKIGRRDIQTYCIPLSYEGEPHVLMENWRK